MELFNRPGLMELHLVYTDTTSSAAVVAQARALLIDQFKRRKVIEGLRPGPNRVGPYGLLTPIADAVKLIFKEIIVPTAANKGLFFLGPIMTIMPALAAWASLRLWSIEP